MTIPTELSGIITRLNQELNQIEKEATRGLDLIRELLPQFGDNLVKIFVVGNSQ